MLEGLGFDAVGLRPGLYGIMMCIVVITKCIVLHSVDIMNYLTLSS